jgi:hypothetical protein
MTESILFLEDSQPPVIVGFLARIMLVDVHELCEPKMSKRPEDSAGLPFSMFLL